MKQSGRKKYMKNRSAKIIQKPPILSKYGEICYYYSAAHRFCQGNAGKMRPGNAEAVRILSPKGSISLQSGMKKSMSPV
jgi:hypothetical protein